MTTATGGFVTRAERGSVAERRTATGTLGPGGYELDHPREALPAPVPFQTSKERHLMENLTTSAITPGVGSYEAATALDLALTRHIAPQGPTANFQAGVPRLAADKSRTNVPGPGAYPESNEWVKKTHHYKAPAPAQRVLFVRVPSAPSIPASHQTYGYEEGDGGVLVMQKAPDPVHTGRGVDTVGPGSYDPAPVIVGKKAAHWANSKTKRGLEFKSLAPGPGTYNPNKVTARSHSSPIVVAVNGVEVQFGGTAGTAQFVSKVPLWSQRLPGEHERTPGPGTYDPEPGVAAKAQPLPEELQCFSTTTKRQSAVDPMKSLSAPSYFRTPGPGAYDDPRRSISLGASAFVDPLPFSATSARFGKADNGLPGPGDYKPEQAVSLAKAAQDKAAVSKSGVFGTMAPRFSARAEADAASAPGPGNYQVREPSPPRHRGDSSTFQSKTSRFRATTAPVSSIEVRRNTISGRDEMPRGDPAALGPGSYTPPESWGSKARHPGYKKTAFGSETNRFSAPAAGVGNADTPGPGRYKQDVDVNKVFRPYTNSSKESVFGSNTMRFKGPASFTPGPGQYIATPTDLVRKSYNITYSGGGRQFGYATS